MREVKTYNLQNGFGIECITKINNYTQNKTYNIRVIMLNVEWHDVVIAYDGIKSPGEANNIFKNLYQKYSSI